MSGLRRYAHLAFFFLISSHWLHMSSAKNHENQHQPSTIPDADVSKPGLGPWPFPSLPGIPEPKPESHKNHHGGGGGGGGGGECHCNCNCDCQKFQSKEKEHDRGGGPVVCLPMTCDGVNGCHLGGGMNVEAANTFQIPQFIVAGMSPYGQSKSPADLNATDAGNH